MAQHELSNKEIIVRLLKSDLSDYDNLMSLLGMANEVIREDKELSRKLANKVRFLALRLCATGDIKYYDLYNKALLFLAQEHKDFDSYLLYVEKNRDPEDRYYQPRRNKIYWLVQKMQRLIDDELDILSISMPPGTGKTTLGEFFISFVMGHYPNTPNLMSSHWASSLKDWFSGSSFGNINNATWTTYAGNIITGFRNKIGLSYTDTKSNITTWASNLKTWFSDSGFGGINSSKWSTYAENIISGFKTKIGNSYTTCKSNITTWASNVKTWFTNTCSYDKWYDIAKNVVDGFKNGIGNLYSTCKNNIESWGSSIISWFKDKLDINSPSRVFKRLGAYSVEGYNIGVEKEGEKTKGIVTSWVDSFADMDVNLGTRLKINDSALKEYSNNYGSDFTNEAIVQRVTREVSTNGTVQATLNSGGGLKEAIKEALDDLGITTAVSEISKNTKTQADKKEQTIVEIGGKTVTDAVTTQRNANGYSFQGA